MFKYTRLSFSFFFFKDVNLEVFCLAPIVWTGCLPMPDDHLSGWDFSSLSFWKFFHLSPVLESCFLKPRFFFLNFSHLVLYIL